MSIVTGFLSQLRSISFPVKESRKVINSLRIRIIVLFLFNFSIAFHLFYFIYYLSNIYLLIAISHCVTYVIQPIPNQPTRTLTTLLPQCILSHHTVLIGRCSAFIYHDIVVRARVCSSERRSGILFQLL